MTAQEIFDQVVNGLRKQGKASTINCYGDDLLTCVYRSLVDEDGKPEADSLKCAAGMIIEDDEYSPEMEGVAIEYLVTYSFCPSSLKNKIGLHLDLIKSLQQAHDTVPFTGWETYFKDIAGRFYLQYTPLT